MLSTRKVLICADGSEMDNTLLTFISFALKSSPIDEVYIVQIMPRKDMAISAEVKKGKEEILVQKKKDLEKKVRESLDQGIKAKVHVIVEQGAPFRAILKMLETKDIDVVISGAKQKIKGSGVFNQRLARRAPCSIIVVPEGYVPKLEKLLIPIDFSENSEQALNYALYISKNNDYKVEIICQHVYEVPVGYHYSGKSFEEFSEVMKDNAKKEYGAWVSKIDTKGHKVSVEFTLNDDDQFGKKIKDLVMAKNVSGVIIGAKGRTAASALLIGSTAEKLIHKIDYLPLTITRKKGSNATLLETLAEF